MNGDRVRVMIVDDECLVAELLYSLVDWEATPFRICAYAQNAAEATEKFHETKPQILLMDVYMPGIDGLTLAEKFHQESPEISIIILSSYENFDYARKAVSVGARQYLLKNELSAESLMQALNDAEKAYRKHQLHRNAYRREKLMAFFSGKECEGIQEIFDFSKYEYCFLIKLGAQPLLACRKEAAEENETKHPMKFTFTDSEEMHIIETFKIREDIWSTLLQIPKQAYREVVKNYRREHEMRLEKGRHLVFSQPAGNLETLLKSGRQCMDCAEHLIFAGDSGIHVMPNNGVSMKLAKPIVILKGEELYQRIVNMPIEQIETKMRALFEENMLRRWNREELERFVQTFCTVLKTMKKEYEVPEVLVSFNPGQDIYGITEYVEWIVCILKALRSWALDEYSPHVKNALRKIRSSYMEPISAKEVADAVSVSEAHLRSLMKKETGKSISEHLTQIRMAVAGKLIETGKFYTYEIANMTGYNNTSYFCEVFKKEMGAYPSDYRKGQHDPQ